MDDSHDAKYSCGPCGLHHVKHLTQDEVAARLGVSRSTASRALREAEKLGIFLVTVTEPLPEASQLAEALVERFGLDRVVVAHGFV